MPGKEYANKPYFSESSANDRMVRGYPPPKYFDLFQDYRDANEMNTSETITTILRTFFDKMDPSEITRIRDLAEKQRAAEKKTA